MATPATNKVLTQTTVAEAKAILDEAAKVYMEALVTYLRVRVHADLMFLETGDRSLVDDARH